MPKPTWMCPHNPGITQVKCRCADCADAIRDRMSAANARKYAKHRERYLAEQKAWYVANREEIRARRQAAHRANPEPQRRRSSEYQREHPRPPAVMAEYYKKYRAGNASRINARQRLREARKSWNTPAGLVVTERDWRRLVARHGGRCAYCGVAGKLTQDHVIPLSRGGRHSIGNLLPCCVACNCSKHARFIIEWRANYRAPAQKR